MARRRIVALALFLMVSPFVGFPLGRTQAQSGEIQAQLERNLAAQRKADNGISVDEPKVYDDSMLQQMLRAAEARLAAMQMLDQTGILGRVGGLSGATQRISSVGVAVQTPQIPGVSTVGRSGGTVTTGSTNLDSEGNQVGNRTNQTVTTSPSEDVTTTEPAFAPPAAPAPAPSTTMPTSFSVSASDALNEQMQLTYEIANLRLLLEGALSDHVMVVNQKRHIKPRITLGFPITIDAQDRFDDAVAVVEVEVEKKGDLGGSLAVTTLLPREKTYNVAAITDSTMSIGGGVVTSVLGVSGTWLTGRKTYYVTQDQDTVALGFQPAATGRIGFRWQFRPVLGKRVVKSGLRQTFVQIAFPAELSATELASMTVRTYWLDFDRKKGTTGDLVGRSVRAYPERTIAPLPIASAPWEFNHEHLHDLGGGQMLVDVPGRFLGGTYVRLGASALREGAGLLLEHSAIRFTAPISDLAIRQTSLVARDGSMERLTIPFDPSKVPGKAMARVSGLDDGIASLTVELDKDVSELRPPPVIVVGNRVFGYSDAPLVRDKQRLTAVVPMSLVLSNPRLAVTSLFATYRLEAEIAGLSALSRAERLVLLEQGQASSRYLLYGSRLSTVTVLEPSGVTVANIGRGEDADTLKLVTLTAAQLRSHKQLVLQRANERPFLLAMPPGERAPTVKARDRLVVGADAATFDVDPGFDTAPTVVWGTRELKAERVDGRTLRVTGLRAAGVTATPGQERLDLTFAAGKSTATMDIVTSRIETVTRPPGQ